MSAGRDVGPAASEVRQQVLGVEDAAHVVHGLVEDRHARDPGRRDRPQRLLGTRGVLDGDHVGARDHDLAHDLGVQV